MRRKAWDVKYEEELRPAIESFDQDPFTSTQLAVETSHSPQSIAHALSNAADEPEYEIEIVDTHPYVFSMEGNEAPVDRENESDSDEETNLEESWEYPVLEEAYKFLEENEEVSETEIRKLLSDEIEADSMESQMSKNGKVFQDLKDYRDVEYVRSEQKFRIEE